MQLECPSSPRRAVLTAPLTRTFTTGAARGVLLARDTRAGVAKDVVRHLFRRSGPEWR